MSHVHSFPTHTYSLFNIVVLFELLGTFLIVFLSLPLFMFTTVVSMAPKRKSTPARNPLHSSASSSSDFAPLSLWFRDDDAHKAFLKKFSRRGVHSEHQVIWRTSATLTFPLSFTVRNGSHCVMSRSLVLSCLFKSFTPTCTGLIIQYLSFSLAFEVHAFLSHRNLCRCASGP